MNKQVFVHLCTWFQNPILGQKWEMWNSDYPQNPHNPDSLRYNQEHDIAAIGYPLTGPYQSDDASLIEYQFQLMKLAGIDGIVVDWDGRRINPHRHQMFLALLSFLEKYNLKLIVCFEEWAGYYPSGIFPTRGQEILAVEQELSWLAENIMSKPYYAVLDGKKPIYIFRKVAGKLFSGKEWAKIKKDFEAEHVSCYFPDPYETEFNAVADGWFFWIGGFDDKNSNSLEYLGHEIKRFNKQCYDNGKDKTIIHSVVPGFDDSEVWGWGDHPRIAPRYDGQRYRFMWEQAIESQAKIIQIVTWNDWNEGSHIEPSTHFGYQYLKLTREYSDLYKGIKRSFDDSVFEIPLVLYRKHICLDFNLSRDAKVDLIKILQGGIL